MGAYVGETAGGRVIRLTSTGVGEALLVGKIGAGSGEGTGGVSAALSFESLSTATPIPIPTPSIVGCTSKNQK